MPTAGSDTNISLSFSRSLDENDFTSGVRFTIMYGNAIQVRQPSATGSQGVVTAEDGSVLGYYSHFDGSVNSVQMQLRPSRNADWRLLGVTYNTDYQLKPSDLNGLFLEELSIADAYNELNESGHVELMITNTPMALTLSNSVVKVKLMPCDLPQSGHHAYYNYSRLNDGVVINSDAACSTTDTQAIVGIVLDIVSGTLNVQLDGVGSTFIPNFWVEY